MNAFLLVHKNRSRPDRPPNSSQLEQRVICRQLKTTGTSSSEYCHYHILPTYLLTNVDSTTVDYYYSFMATFVHFCPFFLSGFVLVSEFFIYERNGNKVELLSFLFTDDLHLHLHSMREQLTSASKHIILSRVIYVILHTLETF